MLLALSCVSLHPAMERAFQKHAKGHTLRNAVQLRRVVRDLGTDLSVPNSHTLLEAFATNSSSVSLQDLDRLIETSTSTSPTKYVWLVVDPNDNGIRARRPHWNRFGRAGLLSPTRIAHYGVGLASLAIGTADLVDFVAHTGFQTVPVDAAFAHGCVHTLAATLSLTRFNYKWTKPFNLWMPTARDASMWPAFLVSGWYTFSLRSTFVAPSTDAWFSMTDPSFQLATWTTTFVMLYSSARTILEKNHISGVYETRMSNSLQVIATMALPILADSLKCSLLTKEPYYSRFKDMVSQHPQYTQVYAGAALTAMFLGSLACALSSAEHHKAVTKREIGDFIGGLTAFAAFLSVYAMLQIEQGELAFSMMRLLIDAIVNIPPSASR